MEQEKSKVGKVIEQMRVQADKEHAYWSAVSQAITELNDRAHANLLARNGEVA